MKHLSLLLLGFSFILAGCTGATVQTTLESASPTTSVTPSPTPTETPSITPSPVNTTSPSRTPVEVKKTMSPKPSGTVQGASTTIQSGSSSTNITVNNNNSSVKVISKNGKRYAEVDGKEVELDASGCYYKEENGSKTHICVNSN